MWGVRVSAVLAAAVLLSTTATAAAEDKAVIQLNDANFDHVVRDYEVGIVTESERTDIEQRK